MPSLKDYRDRIASVKSTRKITSAMKMVAASKLKKAQEKAEASQPYAQRMGEILARVSAAIVVGDNTPKLLAGTGKDDVHLLLVITSDRGLCGGFNSALARDVRKRIQQLKDAGKTVKIVTVGRKGRDLLKREHSKEIVKSITELGGKSISFDDVAEIQSLLTDLYAEGEFDVCTIVYNRFKNVITQEPTFQQLIPFAAAEDEGANDNEEEQAEKSDTMTLYEFEPEEEEILAELLPKNLGVQIFRALLDSNAGEQAARMTAMDNATRNAGEMIDNLTLQYNRARQAHITKELIEIISGAEAL